jgi:hypothetical protein
MRERCRFLMLHMWYVQLPLCFEGLGAGNNLYKIFRNTVKKYEWFWEEDQWVSFAR